MNVEGRNLSVKVNGEGGGETISDGAAGVSRLYTFNSSLPGVWRNFREE